MAASPVPRRDIVKLDNLGRSFMPEGLEAQLDHQAMADLLAYLMASSPSRKGGGVRNIAESLLLEDGGMANPLPERTRTKLCQIVLIAVDHPVEFPKIGLSFQKNMAFSLSEPSCSPVCFSLPPSGLPSRMRLG